MSKTISVLMEVPSRHVPQNKHPIYWFFFSKLSIITHKIPFRIITIAYPKPTQLPWAAKSLCGRRKAVLSINSTVSTFQCRAGFQKFVVCCHGGGERHMQTSFLCVNGEVLFAFKWSVKVQVLWLDMLLPATTALWFIWLSMGSRDIPKATSGKKIPTNQTHLDNDPPPLLSHIHFYNRKSKVKEQEGV